MLLLLHFSSEKNLGFDDLMALKVTIKETFRLQKFLINGHKFKERNLIFETKDQEKNIMIAIDAIQAFTFNYDKKNIL